MNKNKWISVLLVLTFLMGLSLVLYPSFSDYWNSTRSSSAIASYVENINSMETSKKDEMLAEAQAFNEELKARYNYYTLPDELRLRYNNVLDTTGTGIMAYVEIPSIKVMLPIYHGTADAVLQTAVGHLEWSSLPVGGTGTHTVISGHRGLPSAKLFTDLDQIVVGDQFYIHVLDEHLAYEVDQINVVLPEEISLLDIVPGEDLVTLVTCTPYGVNTHRLLVRGHRVPYVPPEEPVKTFWEKMSELKFAIITLLAVLLAADILFIVFRIRKRKQTDDSSEKPEHENSACSEPDRDDRDRDADSISGNDA